MLDAARKKCVICESELLTEKLVLAGFPILMGTSDDSENEDEFLDQFWDECGECGQIQLRNTLPLEILYRQSHNTEVIGDTWIRHHLSFLEFVNSLIPRRCNIVEIGAGHGFLAEKMVKANLEIEKYSIIEPGYKRQIEKVEWVQDFYQNRSDIIRNSDAIIHSHVLEHVYNPREFLKFLGENMKRETIMFVSFPNIKELINLGGSNSLNFEHTYFLHPSNFAYICDALGLEVIKFDYFEKHSYFCALRKNSDKSERLELPNIAENSREFLKMWRDIEYFASASNSLLSSRKSEENFVFGAHVFTQSLINRGLNTAKIRSVLDNSQAKFRKRLYGTNLYVDQPSALIKCELPLVILSASHYQDEIKSQLNQINPNVEFFEFQNYERQKNS
jgi:2-polyprenyl-3-methyl-5-hydroxy-6-metoxy-1,4-benzoquinol methylase